MCQLEKSLRDGIVTQQHAFLNRHKGIQKHRDIYHRVLSCLRQFHGF